MACTLTLVRSLPAVCIKTSEFSWGFHCCRSCYATVVQAGYEALARATIDQNGNCKATSPERFTCCNSMSALIPMQEDPERIIIFRGLRVRMCVVTGVPDPSASALAKPVDKYPALLPILKAMATIAQGGQVLCASSTYTLINSRLTDIARRVPEQPNAPFNSMQSALHG